MIRLFMGITLLLATSAIGAQDLGRLFFTPEERAALDARRKARVPDRPAAPVVASPTTRLDGYVRRSEGRSTVWVNGEALPERPAEARRLKPGEVLDRGTGEVRDVIGDGEIRIRRAE
jgi:hypothetical protein